MLIKKLTILFFILILLASCEEQFEWPLSTNEDDLLVVEAVLTNENKNHLIKLTKTFKEQNLEPGAISGAFIAILTDSDTTLARENPPGRIILH